MKTCKRCGHEKPLSEYRPDPRYKAGVGSWCIECHRARGSEWAKENRTRLTAKRAVWCAANPEKARAIDKKWKRGNKDKVSAQYRKWRTQNLAYDCARVSARKASKLKATPKWANQKAINDFYKNKPRGFDVDHIVPLVSPIVCGLHCEANLQYLPSAENQSKRNFYWPDMPHIDNAYRQQRMFA